MTLSYGDRKKLLELYVASEKDLTRAAESKEMFGLFNSGVFRGITIALETLGVDESARRQAKIDMADTPPLDLKRFNTYH